MSDGRKYHATPLIYPVHHHPGAPHTGIVYSRALIAAYAEPLGSALVMSYVGAVDMTNTDAGADMIAAVKLVTSISPIKVCEAFRRLDGTHIVAEVTFHSPAMDTDTEAFHILEVTGNSITVDADSEEEATPANKHAWQNYFHSSPWAEYVYSGATISTTTIELELDPDQIGHDCQIVLSGCAASASASVVAPYRLLSVVAWQEVR